jgi:hypothetical protein
MNTPRFVVKSVGNDYKIVRADAEGVVLSGLSTVVGSMLLLKGLRGGLIGKAIALAGGGLIYYGVTGENPIEALHKKFNGTASSKAPSDSGPSFQHDAHAKVDQRPEDEVDEASMESFPASDPPAHHHSTATA